MTVNIPVSQLDPVRGNVAFCAGLQGWGFTLPQMAEVYSARLGAHADKLRRRLWGDSYYDNARKKWVSSPQDGAQRGFCQFVLDPVYKVHDWTCGLVFIYFIHIE